MFNKVRRKVVSISILLIVMLIVGCTNTIPSSTTASTDKSTSKATTETKGDTSKNQQETPQTKINTNYKIEYTLKTKRFDKGMSLYVLIDPVDLNKKSFEDDVKLIINKLVKEYGSKTSIEFHDDKKSLDISYKLYGDLTLGRNTNQSENELLAVHHISSFDGNLSTSLFKNTLYFFPETNSDNKNVGNLVEIVEYNPS